MYTIDHIKSAFNAGKQFQTYEDWVQWSVNEIHKIKTSDPRILINKLSKIGAEIRERESDHHILVDLRSITREDVSKFLNSELFDHRGYGRSSDYYRYYSRKYDKMSIDYDSSSGFIYIFHEDPITKEQEMRDKKIDILTL